MKAAKIIIMLVIYAAFFHVACFIWPLAIVGYGKLMGAVFAFFPLILTLFCYKSMFRLSGKILGLFIKIDPDYMITYGKKGCGNSYSLKDAHLFKRRD